MPKKKSIEWTLDQCVESASKYQSPLHWKVKNASAYNAAMENGWLTICFPNSNERKGWTLDDCLAAAASAQSKEQWIHENPLAYKAAVQNGWLGHCLQVLPSKSVIWTLEMCQMSAIRYHSMLEWQKGAPKAYKTARRNKWFELCCQHMDRLSGGKLTMPVPPKNPNAIKVSGPDITFW